MESVMDEAMAQLVAMAKANEWDSVEVSVRADGRIEFVGRDQRGYIHARMLAVSGATDSDGLPQPGAVSELSKWKKY
jgi:hypothetical protein